jgi:nickel-type superoxide dismutase maturation protease
VVERVAWSPSAHYRLVAGLLTAAAIARLLRRVGRVEVEGDSMRPTLEPGDRLVVLRGRRARPGDLVTVPDPRAPLRVVVKRVATGGEPGTGGMVVVRGDNPDASTDSRTFGPVAARSIQGRVVYRYFPERRRGRPQR